MEAAGLIRGLERRASGGWLQTNNCVYKCAAEGIRGTEDECRREVCSGRMLERRMAWMEMNECVHGCVVDGERDAEEECMREVCFGGIPRRG